MAKKKADESAKAVKAKPEKFYFRGVIWDKENKKALCQAMDGVYETDDKRIIDKLKEMEIPQNPNIKIVKEKDPELQPYRKKPQVIIPDGVKLKGKR